MGTNYYARIIPPEHRKKALKVLINQNDFRAIKADVDALYGQFRPYSKEEPVQGEVHLGKASGGWKFLWNPNVYVMRNGHTVKTPIEGGYSYNWVPEPDTAYYTYPLTKKGIKAFIDRDDVEIYDEYGEKQDKDKFFKMALEWTTRLDYKTNKVKEAWDAASYEKEYPDKSRWECNTELTQLLQKEGFVFTSSTNSDFYSDGLRFSSSNDFC